MLAKRVIKLNARTNNALGAFLHLLSPIPLTFSVSRSSIPATIVSASSQILINKHRLCLSPMKSPESQRTSSISFYRHYWRHERMVGRQNLLYKGLQCQSTCNDPRQWHQRRRVSTLASMLQKSREDQPQ